IPTGVDIKEEQVVESAIPEIPEAPQNNESTPEVPPPSYEGRITRSDKHKNEEIIAPVSSRTRSRTTKQR
ncbi:hypothetical protein MKX01_027097, partial [Papaver californicum]